ncbi:hypothetical protein CapIbe_005946 [Capra ibex]
MNDVWTRWDSPGEKTRHLLRRVSHKSTATCVCLAWQGPQTRLPGPPLPPPTAIRQNKPGAVDAVHVPHPGPSTAFVAIVLVSGRGLAYATSVCMEERLSSGQTTQNQPGPAQRKQ